MQRLKLNPFPNSQNFAIKSLFSFFASLSKTPNSTNFIFLNFLIKTLNIPKSRALPISNKFSRIKSLEKPETVRQFLHNVGFSDTHIQLTVTSRPTILFSDVDKTLKPKIEFFQHLGLVGSDLGKFISKNPSLFAASLERKLIPCVEILKKILVDDSNNEDLTRVFRRCCWNLIMDTEKSGLLRNIEYLKSCGIVGSQLSMLLVWQPRLFCYKELKIRHLVSRLLDMGFSTNSRMFVYGLVVLSCLNEETFGRKLELFRSYGFSKEEVLQMFRKAPLILKASEERLQLGLEFFLKEIECEKSVLNPQNVRQFLHSVGFSDTHIQLAVYTKPTILFADVNKTLKPKIGYFQQLGLVGSDLAEDYNNEDLIRVIRRMSWNLVMDTEKSGLLRNIEYVKSCGIVGSQLSRLLVRQTRLFCFKEPKLRHLVSRLLEMGFSTNSRMFVYGLHALSCLSEETFDRKLELFRSYGFSKEEFMEMFRRAPGILKSSEERLKSGLEFFLKEIEFEKAVLVHIPVCLTLSIENRVIPRYRVFQIVTSRGMLKKGWSFPSFLISSEENFLKKFVLSFGDDAEELLRAYKGHKLGSSFGEQLLH
ncbi:hypothetical protein KPL70_021903 [Citrus sinensis]|nr:hypothetical protein KPL70_021903 [Citrus sinensis]